MASRNLGKFAELPGEIRNETWRNLRPEGDSIKTSMSILRTCRQLWDEVSPQIYNKEVLTFKLPPIYAPHSWITVPSSLGATWTLTSLSHAKTLGFGALPYEMLQGIEIHILATDPADPGQLFHLWTKTHPLVQLLQREDGNTKLGNLAIHLLDTETTHWGLPNGDPQRSFWSVDEDYDIILLELCRLRNFRNTEIHLPLPAHQNWEFVTFFNHFVGSSVCFGKYIDEDDDGAKVDEATVEFQSENFFDLQRTLDHARGDTASIMRDERLIQWLDGGIVSGSSKVWIESSRERRRKAFTECLGKLMWRESTGLCF
jgi:hypothetical protein